MNFYTYPLPGQGLTKMILRGLSTGITTEEIKMELIKKGLPLQRIIQFKDKITKREIPIFICMFASGTSVQEIRNIDRLCYMCIRWEKYKNKSKFIQCYRCLGFNHTSKTCKCAEQCIKCGGAHSNLECKSIIEKCANCTEAHWANSPDCPVIKKVIEKRQKVSQPKKQIFHPPSSLERKQFPDLPLKTIHQSSSNFWTQNPFKNNQQEETNQGILQEILSLIKTPGITLLLKKLVKLLRALSLAKSGSERLTILLEEGVTLLNNE